MNLAGVNTRNRGIFACKIEEKFYHPLVTQYNLPLHSATQIALKDIRNFEIVCSNGRGHFSFHVTKKHLQLVDFTNEGFLSVALIYRDDYQKMAFAV